MAEQDATPPGNGAGDAGTAPQVATLAQYVKDLSVESPSSPDVFQWQDQPRIDVQFNIAVNRVNDEMHEVVLKFDVSGRSDKGVHFLVELSYAGLFGLRNVPEDAFGPFLLIEAPRLLFPFARQVIAESIIHTGFPPLLLDPIDFGAAYMAQVQAQQGQGNGAPAAAVGDQTPGTPAGDDDKG